MKAPARIDWGNLAFSATPHADGGGLSEEEVAALEARVLADANDVNARVRLVGYDFGRITSENQQRRAKHLAWLAEHRPDIGLGGFGTIIEEYAPEACAATRAAWRAAASRPDATVDILENAASFLASEFPEEVELLFRRAADLEPTSEGWRKSIARTLTRRAERTDDAAERRRLARAAIAELEIALTLARLDWVELGIRIDLTDAGVLAADWNRVRETAERVLVDNETCKRTFQYGNAIHKSNIALGWAALAHDEVERAAEYLVQAGKTPGSPQLNTFGPDRHLAHALLARGARDAVLTYLADCARFWKGKEPLLEKWRRAIERGEPTTLERSYDSDDD